MASVHRRAWTTRLNFTRVRILLTAVPVMVTWCPLGSTLSKLSCTSLKMEKFNNKVNRKYFNKTKSAVISMNYANSKPKSYLACVS